MTELTKYKLTQDYTVELPVGFNRNGKVYREIVIDEWRGIDSSKLSKPAFKQNPIKGLTDIVRRLVQEIPGLMPPKDSKTALCSRHFIEEMYQADRDFILVQALILADEVEKEMEFSCENCHTKLLEDINLLECDVYSLGDNEPKVSFSVPHGYTYIDTNGNRQIVKEFTYHLPTVSTHEKLSKYQNEGELAFLHRLLAEQITYNDNSSFPVEVLELGKKKDLSAMKEVIGELIPGVDLTKKVCCEECGHEMEVAIDLPLFFL